MNKLRLYNHTSKSDIELLSEIVKKMKRGVLNVKEESNVKIEKVSSVLYDGLNIDLIFDNPLYHSHVLATETGATKLLYLKF